MLKEIFKTNAAGVTEAFGLSEARAQELQNDVHTKHQEFVHLGIQSALERGFLGLHFDMHGYLKALLDLCNTPGEEACVMFFAGQDAAHLMDKKQAFEGALNQ